MGDIKEVIKRNKWVVKKTPLKITSLLGRMLKDEERAHLAYSRSCKRACLAGTRGARETVAQMKVLVSTEALVRNLNFI